MNKYLFYILCLLCLNYLTSCLDNDIVIQQTKDLKNNKWSSSDTAFFKFDITESEARYDIYIDVRNTVDYSYSNLYCFTRIYAPDNSFKADTVELIVAGDDGRWRGKGLGYVRDLRILFKNAYTFQAKGEYRIAIIQGMRTNLLEGIGSIGIRVEKNKEIR